MEKSRHEFTWNGDTDVFVVRKRKLEAGKFVCPDFPGEEFYRSTQFDIYINKSTLKDRLDEKKKTTRKSDHTKVKGRKKPFDTYAANDGQECPIPTRLVPFTDQVDYNDEQQSKLWEVFANYLVKADKKAGTKPQYLRYRLAPTASTEVFFTPLARKPVLGVTKEVLQDVIDQKTGNTGNYDNWKLTALTYDEANQRTDLKIVGTNFLCLYHAWMKRDEYVTLWNAWNSPSSLMLPFPKNDKKTRTALAGLNQGLNAGGHPVDGIEIPLTTQKIQSAARKRKDDGDNALAIMGKSATDFIKLWGDNPPATGMKTPPSEWLHRSAYSFGGILATTSLKSSDSPNNLIFGSAECNTDMIRAETFIKGLLAQDGTRKFKGSLTTTCTRDGKVTRRDFGLVNPRVDVPTFEVQYPWLCFELKYVFKMPQKSSPFGCVLNAETKFDPWSLYVPLAIEPRMDTWLISYLKGEKLTPKLPKALADTSFMTLPALDTIYFDLNIATLAWKAAQAGLSEIELPDMVVKNPRVLAVASDSVAPQDESDLPVGAKAFVLLGDVDIPVPPGGFVFQGDMKIFGTPIIGQLERWLGPPPADIVVGIDPPCWERVTLPGDFHLSTLIPLLKDTPYDVITFRNVALWHQNYEFDKTRATGWHFDADWVIEPSCGVLHDVLRTVLRVDKPVLSIHAALGSTQQWDAPLDFHSFTLEGIFAGLALSPIPGLQLTSIGVRLLGIRGFELNPEPHATLSYGFSIFGTMTIDVPGSIIPLDLTYTMGVDSGYVGISAEISGDIWKNALGVQNLMLEDVSFATSFSLSSAWKSLSFSTSATFWYLGSQAVLSGSFSPDSGQFELAAGFDEFGMQEIDSIFYTLFGESLSLPDYDLHIGSAVFSIASGTGISLALQNVNVAGHTALDVAVSLSTSGVQLSGALSSTQISFGQVSIHDAALNISFWTEKNVQVDIMLAGSLTVDFLDATIKAYVHLYPGDTGVDWAVIASLSANNKPIAISDIVSSIEKGSYLDLSLRDAAIIAASRDDLATSPAFLQQYTVRQGIQVAAIIDSLPMLDTLLKSKVSGLVLSAGWSKESGFDLKIDLPTSTLDFGGGIRSTPISLEIRTKPLELAVSAGLVVPVKDSKSLEFTFALAAGVDKASTSAHMHDWWDRPFGVDNFKIGPTVTLAIEITYSIFMTTGTPTGFGVSGGFEIGSTPAEVTMNITEDPKGQLLSGSLKNLDVSDVIEFGGKLVQADIPKIHDLLKFEKLSLYVCPFGVNLGGTTYPAGFSFKAALLFLKHRADIECTIDKTKKSVFLNGGVDNFELGPLSVRGATGPRAKLECELGTSTQELILDGIVDLFDSQAQIYVHFQLLPSPTFKFHTLLQFAHIFTYQLDAELLGSLDTLKDADFILTSTFESHVLDYVAQQIIQLLNAVEASAKHGLEVAQQKTEEAKQQWQSYVDDKQYQLLEAQKRWQEYEQSIRGSSQPIIDNWVAEVDRLESKVDNARKTFDGAMAEAQNKLEEANRHRGAAMADAGNEVLKAKQKWADDVGVAKKGLDDATAAVSHAFGDAQQAVKDAEAKVATWQNEIDEVTSRIKEYADAPAIQVWKKLALVPLGGELAGLEAGKLAAEGVLHLAQGVLHGTDLAFKEGAVVAAQKLLDGAEAVGQAGLDAARKVLDETDKATQMAVDQAGDLLKLTEKGVDSAALKLAKQTLEAFKSAQRAVYDAAVDAIGGLMKSAEYLAFTAAQAGLNFVGHFTDLLDVAKGALHLAEEASGTIATIMGAIVNFGAKAVNIQSMSLSGTLRGALGLGGENSRPLSATVEGYVLGVSFKTEVTFDPKDAVAFVKALFDQLWSILKGAANTLVHLVDTGSVKSAPAQIVPIFASPTTVAFRTLVTSKGDAQRFDHFLPPVPSERQDLLGSMLSTSDSDGEVTFIAPLIAVEHQVELLPFAVARARFIEYQVKGTHEDTEPFKRRGLVMLPAGPFTAGPPSNPVRP